jgi:hypothetical protein
MEPVACVGRWKFLGGVGALSSVRHSMIRLSRSPPISTNWTDGVFGIPKPYAAILRVTALIKILIRQEV